jgi:lipopolysaccharide/colanic/teichoic acid biosynthesis glycosyltransferase
MRRRVGQLALIVATSLAVVGLFTFHATAIAEPRYSLGDPGRTAAAAGWTIGLLFVAYMAGLPDAVRTVGRAVGASFAAPAVTVGVASIIQLAAGDALLPRFVVFASMAVMPVVNLLVSLPLVASRGRGAVVAVVLASPDQLADLERVTERGLPNMLRIGATLSIVPGATDAAERLREVVETHRPSILVLADQLMNDSPLAREAAHLHAEGMRIRTLLGFYEDWFRLVPLSELAEVSLLFDIGEVHSPVYLRLNRLLDLVAGVTLGLAFIVAVPFVAIGNLLGNRGPLIYSQPRVGKLGEEFRIHKLRTMVPRRDADDPTEQATATPWTEKDDPRVTPFGKVLRKLHIDELPQAANILSGDLSLVGPRPEQPSYVAELSAVIPFYDHRHLVKPGLTGWAQINLGYTSDSQGAREKLQYEFYYLRNQSLPFDLRIVILTLRSLVALRKAR